MRVRVWLGARVCRLMMMRSVSLHAPRPPAGKATQAAGCCSVEALFRVPHHSLCPASTTAPHGAAAWCCLSFIAKRAATSRCAPHGSSQPLHISLPLLLVAWPRFQRSSGLMARPSSFGPLESAAAGGSASTMVRGRCRARRGRRSGERQRQPWPAGRSRSAPAGHGKDGEALEARHVARRGRHAGVLCGRGAWCV